MIRTCTTPGCGTLTLGPRCLACEQSDPKAEVTFVRGRSYAAFSPAARGNDPLLHVVWRRAGDPSG
jgi:hypothetical protein